MKKFPIPEYLKIKRGGEREIHVKGLRGDAVKELDAYKIDCDGPQSK